MTKNVVFFLILLVTVCYLAGCGRVSKPVAPDNATYPHKYVVSEN